MLLVHFISFNYLRPDLPPEDDLELLLLLVAELLPPELPLLTLELLLPELRLLLLTLELLLPELRLPEDTLDCLDELLEDTLG